MSRLVVELFHVRQTYGLASLVQGLVVSRRVVFLVHGWFGWGGAGMRFFLLWLGRGWVVGRCLWFAGLLICFMRRGCGGSGGCSHGGIVYSRLLRAHPPFTLGRYLELVLVLFSGLVVFSSRAVFYSCFLVFWKRLMSGFVEPTPCRGSTRKKPTMVVVAVQGAPGTCYSCSPTSRTAE